MGDVWDLRGELEVGEAGGEGVGGVGGLEGQGVAAGDGGEGHVVGELDDNVHDRAEGVGAGADAGVDVDDGGGQGRDGDVGAEEAVAGRDEVEVVKGGARCAAIGVDEEARDAEAARVHAVGHGDGEDPVSVRSGARVEIGVGEEGDAVLALCMVGRGGDGHGQARGAVGGMDVELHGGVAPGIRVDGLGQFADVRRE